MSETVTSSADLAEDIQDRLDDVLTVLDDYAEYKDPYRPAFAVATADKLSNDVRFREFTIETLKARPDMGSSQLVHQIARAVQHNCYGRDPSYPYAEKEQWSRAIDGIFDDADRLAVFTVDMRERELQSNISDRYRGLKAFMGLARDLGRLSTTRVLDIGTSRHHGAKYLMSGKPFSDTTIYWPNLEEDPELPDLISRYHTAAFQQLINNGVPLDACIGVDREDISGPVDWARACSFYPHELLDVERVALFDELDAMQFDNIKFYQGDFSNFDDEDFQTKHGAEFDIVHMSTMLYQASPLQRGRMIVKAMEYAQEFVVIQDFVQVDRESGMGLKFFDKWQDVEYPYRTVVLDMREPSDEQRWHEIFQWQDGRVRAMRFHDGQIVDGRTGEREQLWTPLHRRAMRLGVGLPND